MLVLLVKMKTVSKYDIKSGLAFTVLYWNRCLYFRRLQKQVVCVAVWLWLTLLPPVNEVWGKVIFLHLCVILFNGGGNLPNPRGWADAPPGCRPLWMQTPLDADAPLQMHSRFS